MMHASHSLVPNRFFPSRLGIFLICLTVLTLTPRSQAEKGPDLDDAPELEAAIESSPVGGPVSSADPDAESLRDLEKVIESEDAAPAKQASRGRKSLASEEELSLEPDDSSSARNGSLDLEPDGGPAVPEPRQVRRKPERRTELAEDDVVVPGVKSRAPEVPIGKRNAITNLEFKMVGDKSRLVMTAPFSLQYREVRNPSMRQVVYYFDNTETTERLQRAYDTSEFPSPVALFTVLQIPGQQPPASKLIVQMREDKTPTVTRHDRGLYIDFPAPTAGAEILDKLAAGDGSIRANGNPKGLEDEEGLYNGRQQFSGKRIKRLEVKNSEIQDVLRLIAKSSGYNIVIGDDVSGKVGTLSLNDVPWDQAFALVLQSKKLGYARNGNVLRVNTIATLKQERDDAFEGEKSRLKLEPLRTILIPINYATASDIVKQAKSFLTEGRGSIEVDNRSNTVIVRDIDRAARKIQKLFAALDLPPPRVAIAAKFVEMSQQYGYGFGARLGGRQNLTGLDFSFSSPFSSTQPGAMTISAPDFAQLQANLDLGESESKVRTIANPSVTVVANTKATVNQTFSFFIPETQVAGGQTTVTQKQVQTNLALDVTPLVTGEGSIFLDVDLKNEVPKNQGTATTIDARSVKTKVLLENGDTAVLGGVFSNQISRDTAGFPLLSRIPLLGMLFSNRNMKETRAEVFIFITARITNPDESFKKMF